MTTAPTHARYRVVALATSLAMITYLDRACIATLMPNGIARDLGLSAIQVGYVFTIFQFAYALFELPTARWADRKGTRSVLARIVLWWSVMTAATAAAINYPVMLAIRFLFGVGEAGAWPSVARTFSRWIPVRERGRAQGIFFAGAHLVAGGTPWLVMWMLPSMSWRAVFVCFGAVGLVWVVIWYAWFRNDPSEHSSVNAAELQTIVAERPPDTSHTERVDWGALVRSRNMIALCVMYTPNCMIFYFCITWLPSYLKAHGLGPAAQAFGSGLPLFLSMPGDLAGGWLTDWLSAKYGLSVGRCGLGSWAYVVAGVSILAAALVPSPLAAAALISLATGVTMFTLGAAWGTVIDVGRNHVGVVGATMNSTGNLIAMLNPLIVGYSVEWFHSWNLPLYVMGVLFLVGAVCWRMIDPKQPIFEEASRAVPAGVGVTV